MCLACCSYSHAAAGLCCQVSNVILFLNCTRASEVVYIQSHPCQGTAGTSFYHCCRGAITSVKQHGNVWYTTAQQDTPEATALLRFSLHQSEAVWGCAQEAGEPTLPHSTCNHVAYKVSVLLWKHKHVGRANVTGILPSLWQKYPA